MEITVRDFKYKMINRLQNVSPNDSIVAWGGPFTTSCRRRDWGPGRESEANQP